MPRSLADWLEFIERQHPKSIELGLDRVREVAARMGLGRPARRVVTVAGTNGKGSTVAFLEAIARANGWRVGAYTSPHLLRYNERVRIDGHEVADDALVEGFEAVEAAAMGSGSLVSAGSPKTRSESGTSEPDPIPLTYFEYGTLCALWLFERAQLGLVVLEVGLGGRLDATNLVDPDVAVVTTVDLDHQDWLGEGREAIGLEKAGIARAWKPLVLGEDDPPASVLRHAYAIGASAIRAGCDFFFEPLPPVAGHPAQWRWREVGWAATLPMPALAAPVQLRNAATAIAALRAVGKPVSREAIAEGVADAHVAGRLQRFMRDGVEVLVDVGHNPQAAAALADWHGQAPPAGRTHAVYAALADKDAAGVVAALASAIDRWSVAGLEEAGPRGEPVAAFAARLAGTAAAGAERFETVAAALQAALDRAETGDRILVFGSFHTAAAALAMLGSEAG